MTPAQAAPAHSPAAPARTPEAAEAAHLRHLVEKQPACLMRVAIEGAILAANDAALGLLGAKQPSDVLGNSLHAWIVPAHLQAWKDFVSTVAGGTSISLECDVKDLQGVVRSVVFHGVPLVDHMDGIPSVILGARDASVVRRLEAALQESESVREQLSHSSEAPSAEAARELRELQARLDESASVRARLEQSVSKLPQLEQLLKQGKGHLQELRSRLEAATAERERIAAQLQEREHANEALWSDQAQLQQSLAEQNDREVVQLRSDLVQARHELEGAHHELEEARADLAQARDAHQQVCARLESHEAQHTETRAALDHARAAHEDLSQQLREREAEYERLSHEFTHFRESIAARQSEEVEALQSKVHELSAEQLSRTGEHQRAIEEVTARLREAEALVHTRSEERAELERNLLGLQIEHTEQSRIASEQSRVAAEQARIAAEHKTVAEEQLAELNGLRSSLARLSEDRERIVQELRDALSRQHDADKVVADYRVELQSLDLAVRRVEPLAAAGRAALDAAGELLAVVSDIDARSACLVAEAPLESSFREQIEQLRAEAMRAGSLARQILQTNQISGSEEQK